MGITEKRDQGPSIDGVETTVEQASALSVENATQAFLALLTKRLPVRPESASAIMEFVRTVVASEQMGEQLAGVPQRLLRAEDVLQEARLRGESMRSVLEQELVNAEEAGRLLGSDAPTNRRQYANKQREAGVLLAVPFKNKYLYPVFQFDLMRSTVHAAVRRVNKLLDARSDPWGVASWWITPREGLNGRRPADLVGTADEHQIEALADAELEPLG